MKYLFFNVNLTFEKHVLNVFTIERIKLIYNFANLHWFEKELLILKKKF